MQFRPLARALNLHVRMSLRAGSIAFNVHLTVLLTCLIPRRHSMSESFDMDSPQ